MEAMNTAAAESTTDCDISLYLFSMPNRIG